MNYYLAFVIGSNDYSLTEVVVLCRSNFNEGINYFWDPENVNDFNLSKFKETGDLLVGKDSL